MSNPADRPPVPPNLGAVLSGLRSPITDEDLARIQSAMEANRLPPEARYQRDPEFHALVDMIHAWIERCQYTPTEVREAAMLAALKYEMTHLRKSFLIPRGDR